MKDDIKKKGHLIDYYQKFHLNQWKDYKRARISQPYSSKVVFVGSLNTIMVHYTQSKNHLPPSHLETKRSWKVSNVRRYRNLKILPRIFCNCKSNTPYILKRHNGIGSILCTAICLETVLSFYQIPDYEQELQVQITGINDWKDSYRFVDVKVHPTTRLTF